MVLGLRCLALHSATVFGQAGGGPGGASRGGLPGLVGEAAEAPLQRPADRIGGIAARPRENRQADSPLDCVREVLVLLRPLPERGISIERRQLFDQPLLGGPIAGHRFRERTRFRHAGQFGLHLGIGQEALSAARFGDGRGDLAP